MYTEEFPAVSAQDCKETKAASSDTAQLLAAADRFQLSGLVQLCAGRLAKTLTADNLAARIMLADKHHAPALLQHCLDFIRADASRLTEVMDTDGFQLLDKAQMQILMAALAPPSKNSSGGKKRARPADLAADPDMQPPAKDAIKRMKVSELKEKLAEKGLETSGLKADLVERLINALHGHSVGAGSSSSSGSSISTRVPMSDA